MALPGLTDADSQNIEIKAPALNTTKVAFTGAFIVGLVAPILAFISGQDEAVRQMALLISLVAIPSVAFVVGVDTITRGYVTVGGKRAGNAPAPVPENAAEILGSGIAVFDRPLTVKVRGQGDAPFHALAVRREASGDDAYLLARNDTLKWFAEADVEQLVPPRA